MTPTTLSNTIASRSVAARRNEWYELRIYVSYVDAGTGGGYNLYSHRAESGLQSGHAHQRSRWHGANDRCRHQDRSLVLDARHRRAAASSRTTSLSPSRSETSSLANSTAMPAIFSSRSAIRAGAAAATRSAATTPRRRASTTTFAPPQCLTAKSCNGTTVATRRPPRAPPRPRRGPTPGSTGGGSTASRHYCAGPDGTSAAPGDSTAAGGSTRVQHRLDGSTSDAAPSTTSAPMQTTSSAAAIGIAAAALLIGAINL
jgi:hypothetical protein